MATATKERKKGGRRRRAAQDEPDPSRLPVKFGGVSYGDKTCRLGVVVSRGNLTVNQADKLLVGQRLKVSCVALLLGRPDQPTLTGDPPQQEVAVAGSADVKSIGVGTKAIAFGLTFPIEGFDDQHLLPSFAKRDGFVRVLDRSPIPEEEPRLGRDEGNGTDAGGDDEDEEDE